ncbi:MAG: GNAT family N-acetyltransferase [Anaerobutyricum soehngenii]|nr:GNAT family N-acetyltransferase [Anaerobutyricum soehngenii]MCI7271067.1 GNAT family N-acetyltransferase [Anaerobutyricum hallii]MDY5243628.1 GNAT family N-acetyltransferase [Anaerobutyricum soehngenii]
MGTPWMILDADALSPFFLREVYCRHHHIPLMITTTSRCTIRELTVKQLPELLLLQKENKNNPSGCFFPQNCCTTVAAETFLLDYIKNQYSFYGYGIYGIFKKTDDTFLGIAGFSPLENTEDYYVEIGYSILKEWQRQGFASEVLPALLHFEKEYLYFTEVITRIEKENIASIRLAKKNLLRIIMI